MNGKIVIAELEQELAKVKALVAMGKTCGVGGKSIAEVEDGLKMVSGTPPHCCCNCGCCGDEDEDLYDEEEKENEYYEEEDQVNVDLDEIADKLRDVEDFFFKIVIKKLSGA